MFKFTVGHNFPNNTPGYYSESVDAPTLKEAKLSAAKCLYDNYTPYYECEVFTALAEWLVSDDDTFQIDFGTDEVFTFYIEPAAD